MDSLNQAMIEELHTMMTELSQALGLELKYDQHNDYHYMIIALASDRIMIKLAESNGRHYIMAKFIYDVNTAAKLYDMRTMLRLLEDHRGPESIDVIINDLRVLRLLADQRYD